MPIKALLLASLAAIAACGLFDSGPDLPHAAAMADCGPTDGPATRILLAHEPIESGQPPFPYVSVMILQSVGDISPRTWDITTGTAPGVWYAAGPDQYESAISGHVTVTSIDSTNRVEGSVRLGFPSRFVATAFSARWLERANFFCG